MMFSKTNKKLLLMLSIFLCLACVIGSVAAADVNNNTVTDDSDYDNVTVVTLNHTDDCYFPAPKSAFIDYKHLPVGTTITIKIPTHLVVEWVVGDCTGVELIKKDAGLFTQSFMFKVTSENYNIILNNYNRDNIVGSTVATYNFTDNPFEYGAQVTIKKPVNTCLACSNIQDELIGSDVIQMDSLSVLDDAVSVDSDSNSIAIDDAGADIPIITPVNDTETIIIDADGNVVNDLVVNDPNIDYKHLPLGTVVTIKLHESSNIIYPTAWTICDYFGVKLLNEYREGYTHVFMFKVTSENYNIKLTYKSFLCVGGFTIGQYNFMKDPFEYGAKVTVKPF